MSEQLRHWLETYRWRVYGGLFVVLLGFAAMDFILPGFQDIMQQQADIDQAEHQLANVENWQTQKQVLLQHINKLKSEVDTLVFSQSKEQQVSELIRLLDQFARHTKVAINSISPAETLEGKRHIELPLQLELTGSYHAIARFVNKLETAKQIMMLHGVRLFSESMTATTIGARLNVTVFYLKGAQ